MEKSDPERIFSKGSKGGGGLLRRKDRKSAMLGRSLKERRGGLPKQTDRKSAMLGRSQAGDWIERSQWSCRED